MVEPTSTADLTRLLEFVRSQTGLRLDGAAALDRKLERDLGIYGDDAVDFIERFARTFDVRIDAFDVGRHFTPETDGISRWLRGLLLGRTRPRGDLSLRDLLEAIGRGDLA